MNSKEKGLNCTKIVTIDQKRFNVSVHKKDSGDQPKSFTFDAVFDDDSTQAQVYEDTAYPLVQSVMDGYNGTIFAYGQTGKQTFHQVKRV